MRQVEILLIHNRFDIKQPVTLFSMVIRALTGSEWNHLAIRVEGEVIEAVYPRIIRTPYGEWVSRSNRRVLPLSTEGEIDPAQVEALVGQRYSILDLVQALRHVIRVKWLRREPKAIRNYTGYICSELACLLFGIPYALAPGDFEHMQGLTKGKEYTTIKRKKT